jgi:hypothetical protein
MPDTGAPWNIPYVDPTDLVRDYPQASEDLADAVAAGLDAAGGLVAVKHVIKSDVQSSASIATGAGVAISGLSIAHAVADEDNIVYLLAMLHMRADTGANGQVGAVLLAGATALGLGDAEGSRTQLTAFDGLFNNASGPPNGFAGMQANVTALARHAPGTTSSVTYSVNAVNMRDGSSTVFVNRSSGNNNAAWDARPSSQLILMEVKV